jgi:hypothetical protein
VFALPIRRTQSESDYVKGFFDQQKEVKKQSCIEGPTQERTRETGSEKIL